MLRRRFKQTLSLEERLSEEAKRLREEAKSLPPGPQQEALLRRARQAETGSHMSQWLRTPELQDYRAFVVGGDGHVLQRHEFWCANDEEAKERARQFVDGKDVELWHRDHRIATFRHNEATSK
jgi:hypothetical protein